MTRSPTRPRREQKDAGETAEERLRRHVLAAHVGAEGEGGVAQYVAGLEVGECARILVASPIPLSILAGGDPSARVDADKGRSFEEVIRAWTLRVLYRAEAGRWAL